MAMGGRTQLPGAPVASSGGNNWNAPIPVPGYSINPQTGEWIKDPAPPTIQGPSGPSSQTPAPTSPAPIPPSNPSINPTGPPPNVQAPLQHYNPASEPPPAATPQATPLGLTPTPTGGGGSNAALEGLKSAVTGLANTPQSIADTTGETLSQFQPGQPGTLRSGLGTRNYPQQSSALAGLRRAY